MSQKIKIRHEKDKNKKINMKIKKKKMYESIDNISQIFQYHRLWNVNISNDNFEKGSKDVKKMIKEIEDFTNNLKNLVGKNYNYKKYYSKNKIDFKIKENFKSITNIVNGLNKNYINNNFIGENPQSNNHAYTKIEFENFNNIINYELNELSKNLIT